MNGFHNAKRALGLLLTVSLLLPVGTARAEASSNLQEKILLGVLSSSVPAFVEICTGRLARAMEAAGESEVEDTIDQDELQQWVVSQLERRSHGIISDVNVAIFGGTLVGSGWVGLGQRKIRLMAQVEVEAVEGSPRVMVRRIRMDGQDLSPDLLIKLELEMNRVIGRQRTALRFHNLDLRDGFAWVRAETR